MSTSMRTPRRKNPRKKIGSEGGLGPGTETYLLDCTSSQWRYAMIRRLLGVAVWTLLLGISGLSAAKKDPEANLRTVQGVVSNPQGEAVNGAVVQLKNV